MSLVVYCLCFRLLVWLKKCFLRFGFEIHIREGTPWLRCLVAVLFFGGVLPCLCLCVWFFSSGPVFFVFVVCSLRLRVRFFLFSPRSPSHFFLFFSLQLFFFVFSSPSLGLAKFFFLFSSLVFLQAFVAAQDFLAALWFLSAWASLAFFLFFFSLSLSLSLACIAVGTAKAHHTRTDDLF